jgi:hypothetical protein
MVSKDLLLVFSYDIYWPLTDSSDQLMHLGVSLARRMIFFQIFSHFLNLYKINTR